MTAAARVYLTRSIGGAGQGPQVRHRRPRGCRHGVPGRVRSADDAQQCGPAGSMWRGTSAD